MFENACESYKNWICKVGAVEKESDKFLQLGHGCWIDSDYLLTAKHVIDELTGNIVVIKYKSSMWVGTETWGDVSADQAILQVQKVKGNDDAPNTFPTLSGSDPIMATPLGYLAYFYTTTLQTGQKDNGIAFFASNVARRDRAVQGHSRLRLNVGYANKGFSGTPVFTADLCLQAVLIQSDLTPIQDENENTIGTAIFPIASPVCDSMNEIANVVPNAAWDD